LALDPSDKSKYERLASDPVPVTGTGFFRPQNLPITAGLREPSNAH